MTAPAYSDCTPLSYGEIKQRFSASSRAGFRSKRSASYSVTMGESGLEQDIKGWMWGYRVGAQGRRLLERTEALTSTATGPNRRMLLLWTLLLCWRLLHQVQGTTHSPLLLRISESQLETGDSQGEA